MCPYTHFDGNLRGSPHNLEIQTCITFEILQAKLKFSDIRNRDGIMCVYANFDGNRSSP